MYYAELSDRAIIALSGEDAVPFLQGIISNDMNLLSPDTALYTALLSAQGKFLHDFFLVQQQEDILLDIHKDRVPDLLQRLKIYKLRSRVTLEPWPLMRVHALWGSNAPRFPAAGRMVSDPRLDALGWRVYIQGPAPDYKDAQPGDYEKHRIQLGIPDGTKDMHSDKSLLMEFGFEALHGVSFSKGCYVGQEVTARSKFRGQVRKELYSVTGDKELPPCGTAITSGEMMIGELRSRSGFQGIALLRPEELRKITAPLMAGDCIIQYHKAAWNNTAQA